MNRRILIIASCSLVLAVCVSYLVYRAVGAKAQPGSAPAPVAHIVVAARDLVEGTLIHDADLKMAPWTGPLPKGTIGKRDAFVNRGVVSAIYEGEPVTDIRLSAKGSGGGLAGTIPPGMRACAVKVNEVVGVAGFVVSGMRVDVLITGIPPGGSPSEGPKVRTLLQNIQVLSAGTNFRRDQEGKPEQAQVVNLLVTPPQAEMLSLASNETHIQLVLRNPADTGVAATLGTAMSDLFGATKTSVGMPGSPEVSRVVAHVPAPAVASAASVPAVAPHPYVVDVANGSVHTQAKFSRLSGAE